ncbi:MAG: hypothetical protein CLLPBCKN_003028 [Chroococcidiopsis cubana SAG 39.79]|nr:hypothetical protein [Chroococcidiopsis cubana SAG 39.79]
MMRYIRRGAQLCAPTDLVFHRIEKGYIFHSATPYFNCSIKRSPTRKALAMTVKPGLTLA